MASWTKDKRRQYARERRKLLRAQHLCLSCQSKTDGKAYCQICAAKRREQQSVTVKSRKAGGLCVQCGDVLDTANSRCRKCLDAEKPRRIRRKKVAIENKTCPSCGAKTNGRVSCDVCLARHRAREKDQRQFLNSAGICLWCRKNNQLPYASTCQVCYLKTKSYNNLGDSCYWRELLALLNSQKWCCPYTGEKLVLGLNDSLDHKFPRTKFPRQKSDISNVEWTTRDVNQMKADRTPEEFLLLVSAIHNHRLR